MPFTIGCLSFYCAILGFQEYHWFPLFAPLGTRTSVVSATLMVGPFLILHYFPLLRFPLQKPLVDFLVLGVLKGWPLIFSFPRLLNSTFSGSPFGYFPLSHFSQMGWFLPTKLKDPHPPFFMVHLPRFPEIPDPYSWVVGSQTFWSFFSIIGWLGHAPLNCLSPNLALLHISRIPGFWESLGILVQFFSLGFLVILLPLKVGLEFFFPLFCEIQSLPIHRLGSLPMDS